MSALEKAGYYTDPLNIILIFDSHKVVSTLRKDTNRRLETWGSYLRIFCNSIRHIAFNDNLWGHVLSPWITSPVSTRAVAFGAPLPSVRITLSFFHPFSEAST